MIRSRLAPFVLWLATLSLFAGCQYGNGSPCEIDSDCASNHCCGATSTSRGVCRPLETTCMIAVGDAGMRDDAPVDAGTDTGVDAPEQDSGSAIDTGVDAGIDAGEDAGTDAGTDAGDDAGTDAGDDAGLDSGVDAPA